MCWKWCHKCWILTLQNSSKTTTPWNKLSWGSLEDKQKLVKIGLFSSDSFFNTITRQIFAHEGRIAAILSEGYSRVTILPRNTHGNTSLSVFRWEEVGGGGAVTWFFIAWLLSPTAPPHSSLFWQDFYSKRTFYFLLIVNLIIFFSYVLTSAWNLAIFVLGLLDPRQPWKTLRRNH
jgi:hypothetical protein